MISSGLTALLALGAPPSPPGTQPNPTGQLVNMLAMFALMGVMFYFVLIRPQQKKAKEQADLLKSMRPGDKVVTTSGIVGTILTVKERTVSLRSADAKFEMTKTAIAEISERSGESSES
jgi:preprotein translocase subunit YajC